MLVDICNFLFLISYNTSSTRLRPFLRVSKQKTTTRRKEIITTENISTSPIQFNSIMDDDTLKLTEESETLNRHLKKILKMPAMLKADDQLLDFVIKAGDLEIKTHKLVLASNSDYFKAMFSHNSLELERGEVVINDVDPEALGKIVEFFYTYKIDLTDDNVEDILLAASILQVKALEEICVIHAESRINPFNCIGIAALSERCNLPELEKKAFNVCLDQFKLVCQTREFLELDGDYVIRIISDDELNINDEIDVFNAVIIWIQEDQENRIELLEKLLLRVRFTLMEPYKLYELKQSSFAQEFPICGELIRDAMDFQLLKDNVKYREANLARLELFETQPRNSFIRQQRLYAVGGWIDEFKSIASAEVYDPNKDSWEEIEPMTQKRCGVGLTVLGNSIYAVGGHDGQNYLDSVERYDVEKKTWLKDVANMKSVGTSVGVVTLGNYIYAIGGQISTGAIDRVERYDSSTNTWTDCAPMKQQRLGVGVAVYKKYIYVMGGSEGSSVFDTVERYNSKTNTWEYVASMNQSRKHLGACTCRGKIFAVGGRNGQGELDSGEVYDPELNRWTEIKPMSVKRCGIGLVELAGQVYAIGGQNQDTRLNDVEAYDIYSNQWNRRQPMKQTRLGGGMAVHPMRNEPV